MYERITSSARRHRVFDARNARRASLPLVQQPRRDQRPYPRVPVVAPAHVLPRDPDGRDRRPPRERRERGREPAPALDLIPLVRAEPHALRSQRRLRRGAERAVRRAEDDDVVGRDERSHRRERLLRVVRRVPHLRELGRDPRLERRVHEPRRRRVLDEPVPGGVVDLRERRRQVDLLPGAVRVVRGGGGGDAEAIAISTRSSTRRRRRRRRRGRGRGRATRARARRRDAGDRGDRGDRGVHRNRRVDLRARREVAGARATRRLPESRRASGER
eukprot:31018-Pelagococcus_subviridis.AAC.11